MNVADIYRFMEDPSLLSEATLPVLKQIVDRYPYFQSAKLLYLKNLSVIGDPALADEVKQMAVSLPDRKKLFLLLEGEHYGLKLRTVKPEEPKMEDTFSLIDNFLSSVDEEQAKATESPLLFQPSASADYLNWMQKGEEQPASPPEPADEPENRLQHHDLIDSFLRKEEERQPGRGLDLAEEEDEQTEEEIEEPHLKPIDDSYFTETLARIYVKQKRYDKAIQIIKNLSLKYPEKNVYFADQIRFLEKLIINTKK